VSLRHLPPPIIPGHIAKQRKNIGIGSRLPTHLPGPGKGMVAPPQPHPVVMPNVSVTRDHRLPTSQQPSLSKDKERKALVAKRKMDREQPSKEYKDLMETIDHASVYDARSCAVLLGNEYKKEPGVINLKKEQEILLYGYSKSEGTVPSRVPPYANNMAMTAKGFKANPSTCIISSPPQYLRGWGSRNVVSCRAAWAMIRLKELEENGRQGLNLPGADLLSVSTNSTTSASSSLSPHPSTSSFQPIISKRQKCKWINEETAEKDSALAFLSEATEQYLKSIVEGAVGAARRRQNMDGVRIWHQQHATSIILNGKSGSNGSSFGVGTKVSAKLASRSSATGLAPLCLRIGCDVKRQIALAKGNDAKTCQRMEEALERRWHSNSSSSEKHCSHGNLPLDVALYRSCGMSEFSKIPKLPSAASEAEYHAKCNFEVFGGKGSSAPPLGRVPKRCRITERDINFSLKDPCFSFKKQRRVRESISNISFTV